MEEKKQQKQNQLILSSYSFKPTLYIPIDVENKIRYACRYSWNTEWSGILFFDYKGNYEEENLVITCKDILIMDIGSATYTSFDMNPDVISYMTDNDLLDYQTALIHSHNNMSK